MTPMRLSENEKRGDPGSNKRGPAWGRRKKNISRSYTEFRTVVTFSCVLPVSVLPAVLWVILLSFWRRCFLLYHHILTSIKMALNNLQYDWKVERFADIRLLSKHDAQTHWNADGVIRWWTCSLKGLCIRTGIKGCVFEVEQLLWRPLLPLVTPIFW